MKRLFFALMLTVLSGCDAGIETSLEGRWTGVSNAGRKITIIFKENKEVGIQVMNSVAQGVYTIYGSSSPYDLDIDLGKKGKFSTIISVENGRLTMENNAINKARPLEFSKKAVSLIKQ